MKTYPCCDKCGEEIEDTSKATKMGRKIIHFECPADARDRAWRELVNEHDWGF